MQAVILAAGKGTRFKEMTAEKPKCMVEVNGETLIHRLLRQLDTLDLQRIVIVAGYKAEVLRQHVSSFSFETPVEFIINDTFDRANNIISVQKASQVLRGDDSLMFESDLIFADGVLKKLTETAQTDFAVVSPFQTWMDGTCVRVDNADNIVAFVPKDEINPTNTFGLLKTVNVYRLSAAYSATKFLPYLDAQVAAFGGNSYYETVLGTLASIDSTGLKAIELSPDDWYETDDIQDLHIADIKFCTDPIQKMRAMSARFGGYWRFPSVHDYAYLVNPFFPPQTMINEFHANLTRLIVDYPSGLKVNSGLIAKYYGLNPEYAVVGNGAAELIKVMLQQENGRIGVIRPTFEEYPNRVAADQLVYMDTASNGYSYTVNDIERFFGDKELSTLIVINPDNPSGNYLTHRELIELCRWTAGRGIKLVIDESFSDFANLEPVTSMLDNSLLMEFTGLTVIKSISKSFGVPGVRLGILASGDASLIASIKQEVSIWNINSFGEFFLQILEKYKGDYQKGLDQFYEVRDALGDGLGNLDFVDVLPSQANYFMLRLKNDVTAADLGSFLLRTHSILIKDLTEKHGIEGQYVRVAVKTSAENEELLMAMKEFVAEGKD